MADFNSDFITGDDERPAVHGVFAVTIREGRKFMNADFLSARGNASVQLTVHNLSKRTHAVSGNFGNPLWNERKHFPLSIIRNSSHPFNMFTLEVISIVPSDGDIIETKVGKLIFHVHDLLHQSPINGWFSLQHEKHVTGEILLDITFTYGLFGYGFSMQMYEETKSPESRVANSQYPRIEPPPERAETLRGTTIPRATKHPNYIPFSETATLGFGKTVKTVLDKQEGLKFTLLTERMERLAVMREELLAKKHRVDRIVFIQRLLHGQHGMKESLRVSESAVPDTDANRFEEFVVPVGDQVTSGPLDKKEDQTGGTPSTLIQRLKEKGRSWSFSYSERYSKQLKARLNEQKSSLATPQTRLRQFSFDPKGDGEPLPHPSSLPTFSKSPLSPDDSHSSYSGGRTSQPQMKPSPLGMGSGKVEPSSQPRKSFPSTHVTHVMSSPQMFPGDKKSKLSGDF